MTKRYSTIATCLLLMLAASPTLHAQLKGSYLTFDVLGNYYSRLDIRPEYWSVPGTTILTSSPALGPEFRLAYGFGAANRISFEAGFLFGLQPYAFNIAETIPSTGPTSGNPPFFQAFKEYDLNYYGAFVHGQYKFPLTKNGKFQLGLKLGAAFTYHLPWGISYSAGPNQTMFHTEMDVNQGNKIFVNPQGGVHLHYAISERFTLRGGGNFLYSQDYILETVGGYQITTETEILTGSYKMKFRYLGFGAGLDYNL